MTEFSHPMHRVFCAVGHLVLLSQEVERLLKVVLPFIDGSGHSVPTLLARREALSRYSMGMLSREFIASLGGEDVERIAAYYKEFVERRNSLVHHFYERYGETLAAGRYEDVLVVLRRQRDETLAVLRDLQRVANVAFEGLLQVLVESTTSPEALANDPAEEAAFREWLAGARRALDDSWKKLDPDPGGKTLSAWSGSTAIPTLF